MELTKYVMAVCGCSRKKGNIMRKTHFIINLEFRDYYVKTGDTSWKSSLDIQDATKFDSRSDAQYEIERLLIRSIWPKASVMEII